MPRPKSTDTEATRQAIASMAEDLFRTLGYHKTTLADISSRLGMSPANIYRFFRSKQEIVAAICDRFIFEYEATWPASIKAKSTATKNLTSFFLACHRYMRAHFLSNRGIYEMLEVALEQSWPVMLQHVERMTDFADAILKRGVARGEFQDCETRQVAALIASAVYLFIDPRMISRTLQDCARLGVEDRMEQDLAGVLALMVRGISPQLPPLDR